jgi:hypothetical protein
MSIANSAVSKTNGKEFGEVGKLVTPADCKSATLRYCVFESHLLHQVLGSLV